MPAKEEIINQRSHPVYPIVAYSGRTLLPKLREIFKDLSWTVKTELEIWSMYDSEDGGGLVYEVRPKGIKEGELDSVVVCSVTHLKIKKGEPLHARIEKYRKRRMRQLARENRFL